MPDQHIYKFDSFLIDAQNRELLRDGKPVALPAKAFDMLVLLIENRGRLVAKDELFERVWPDQVVEESNLSVQVSAIRKALGERKENPHYIATVPGHGYRFIGQILRFDEEEELQIEQHSISRVTLETEGESGVASAIERSATSILSDGNETRANSTGTYAAEQVNTVKIRRAWLWFAIPAGFVALVAGAVIGYRFLIADLNGDPAKQITLKRLTNNGRVTNAALSPDGKLFAYTLAKDGEVGLWLGHVDGGEPIALRPPAKVTYQSLNFSSDSNNLYFVVTGGEFSRGVLFRMPVFGGVPEKLREGVYGKISFAPDMKQFAYVRTDEAARESILAISDVEGTGERRLVTRSIDRAFLPFTPAWSPDGMRIAAGAGDDDNSELKSEVFVINVADGQMQQLTKRNFSFRPIKSLAWKHNGHGLLMIAVEHPQRDAQIWHVSYPVGEVRPANPDVSDYGSPSGLSADGSSFLALQIQTLSSIWTAPAADFQSARPVTFGSSNRREGVYGLEWTPAGRILYTAVENKSQMIWSMDADGSHQKQLTSAGHVDEDPTVTDNDRFVVFTSNRSGNREIWRMGSDGNALLQLTNGGNSEEASVSPDGNWVVFVSRWGNVSSLWRVSIEGGEPIRLSEQPAFWPRISPDGKLIACEFFVAADSQRVKLAIISIDGGPPIKLFDVPPTVNFRYGLRWTPDGQSVTYRDWVNGIWRQSLSGGEPQRLEGLPEEKLFAYGWSRDGKQFAFTRGTEIRDVVLVRNLK